MGDQGKLYLFQPVIIKPGPYGFKSDGLRRLAQFEQVASRAGGFRISPYFLQGDPFAILFGNNAQAGGATVFGIGLFVDGKCGFQKI